MKVDVDKFACPCCGENKIDLEVVIRLNMAWLYWIEEFDCEDYDLIVTSGYRCEKHNQEVGGAKNSLHVRGLAVDSYPVVPDQLWSKAIRWWFISLIRAGFTGIGETRKFDRQRFSLHADLRHRIGKSPQVWAPSTNLKPWGRYVYFFEW